MINRLLSSNILIVFSVFYFVQIAAIMIILVVQDYEDGERYSSKSEQIIKSKKFLFLNIVPYFWFFYIVVMFFKDVYDGFKKLK